MDWLNYHHLLYFWTIAKEGGISKAAKKLHLALVIAISLALTKSALLTIIASQLPFHENWALPMNMLFAILYLQSLLLTWRWAMPSATSTPGTPAVASG